MENDPFIMSCDPVTPKLCGVVLYCIVLLRYYIITCNYLFDSCNCDFGVLLTRADWAHCVHHKKIKDINQYRHRFHELLLFYTQKILVGGRFDERWTALTLSLQSHSLLQYSYRHTHRNLCTQMWLLPDEADAKVEK